MNVIFRGAYTGGIVALVIATISWATPLHAHSIEAGPISIEHPWSRPTYGDVDVGAVYMVVSNDGEMADTLLAIKSDAAERVEIHETINVGDVAKMQAITGGVEIPADDAVIFEPLGKHVMLIGVKKKLEAGKMFQMQLVFKNAGEVAIDVKIIKGSSAKPSNKPGHAGSHHR